jgi:hypothetical protein
VSNYYRFWLINLISRTFQHATWTLSHAARQPLLTLYQPIELQPKPPTSIGYFNICVASFDLRCNPVCGLLGPPVYSLVALCCLWPSCALRSQTPAIGPSSAAVNRLLSLRYSSFSPCVLRRRASQSTRLAPTPKDCWFWRSLNLPLNNQPKPPVLQSLPLATRTNPIPPGTGPLCRWNPLPLSRSAPPRGSWSLVHRTPDLFTPPLTWSGTCYLFLFSCPLSFRLIGPLPVLTPHCQPSPESIVTSLTLVPC